MKKKQICLAVVTTAISVMLSFSAMAAGFTLEAEFNGVRQSRDYSGFYNSGYLPKVSGKLMTAKRTAHYDDGDSTTDMTYLFYDEMAYPGWADRNGYYYYLTDVNTCIKNTTTPDGYTVGADGRWTGSDGQPVSDGFGGNVLGTAEKYAGKTDEEIWNLQKEILKNTALGNKYTQGFEYFENKTGDFSRLEYHDTMIYHNQENHAAGTTEYAVYSMCEGIDLDRYMEISFRAMLGDELGIEMFNYLRSLQKPYGADWTTGFYIIDYANGFDYNRFNGRTTDYGKTVATEYSAGDNHLRIVIH